MNNSTHNLLHFALVIFISLIKDSIVVFVSLIFILLSYLLIRTKITFYMIALGIPLASGGVVLIIISVVDLIEASSNKLINKSRCLFCKNSS